MSDTTEEVIYSAKDESWDSELPVKLITYKGGGMDIHRQSGSQFSEAILNAEEILAKRGLRIDHADKWMWGSTGGYKRVVKI